MADAQSNLTSLHTSTRVPVDDSYAALVGKAVYVFAYYEWTLIWIIELLQSGFVGRYCRGTAMTSGQVKGELQAVITNPATTVDKVTQEELQSCCAEFERLVTRRNALIRAHPATDTDGSPILLYQAKVTNPLPDMNWPKKEVEAIIAEFDGAACRAAVLLDKLR